MILSVCYYKKNNQLLFLDERIAQNLVSENISHHRPIECTSNYKAVAQTQFRFWVVFYIIVTLCGFPLLSSQDGISNGQERKS
jgi:hypothetical protein